MVYLDNAATTFPKPESVYAAMDKANRELGVNAGRGAYKKAREASNLVNDTKNLLRKLIHADITASVVLGPSVTIALNQIINGLNLNPGTIVYLSPYEHNAVARPIYYLSQNNGIKVKLLPIDDDTLEIDLDKTKYEFSKERPSVVICTHVSNVTGYVLPVGDVFSLSKTYGAINILDAAQSLGLIPIDVRGLQVDIVAFAGHKTLYGPFGVGGFVNISGIDLKEYITGGTGSDSLNLKMPNDLEGRHEAASRDIVAISGLNAALKVLDQERLLEQEKRLTNYCIQKLKEIDGIHLYLYNNQVGIISLTIDRMNSEDVATILDEDFDVAIRTGYHCAPYIHDYLKDKKSSGTIRIGLGQFNTEDDVDKLIVALKELVY